MRLLVLALVFVFVSALVLGCGEMAVPCRAVSNYFSFLKRRSNGGWILYPLDWMDEGMDLSAFFQGTFDEWNREGQRRCGGLIFD